jgi:hypothetical protein
LRKIATIASLDFLVHKPFIVNEGTTRRPLDDYLSGLFQSADLALCFCDNIHCSPDVSYIEHRILNQLDNDILVLGSLADSPGDDASLVQGAIDVDRFGDDNLLLRFTEIERNIIDAVPVKPLIIEANLIELARVAMKFIAKQGTPLSCRDAVRFLKVFRIIGQDWSCVFEDVPRTNP